MSEIRDPIYGFIEPTDTELKIINTAVFQRLRRIKQLAMAYLVYPGANHTRFEHSLGVYYLACRMTKKLFNSQQGYEDNIRIIRYAALLHDIGHGPFSHISESILNLFSTNIAENDNEKIHELITRKIISENEELKRIISEDDRNSIIGLLKGDKVDFTLMKEIISGPLDADKLDYLLRDSFYCGVKYGIFDLERFLNTISFIDKSGDKNLVINYDGINCLEQFVLAKYFMHSQVYGHKVRLITDQMIIRAMEVGISEDKLSFLEELYTYKDTNKYIENYTNYYDENIIYKILNLEKNYSSKIIIERLLKRQLLKQVFSEKFRSITFHSADTQEKLASINNKENQSFKKDLENKISRFKELECESKYVILNSYQLRTIRDSSKESEDKILIRSKNGDIKDFEEESIVFNSISQPLKDIFLDIYAPLEFSDKRNKAMKKKSLRKKILELLEAEELN